MVRLTHLNLASTPEPIKSPANHPKGTIYDHHSTILPGGERDCPDGLQCYRTAYWITFVASLAGMGLTLWSIRHEHVVKARLRKERSTIREA